MIGDDIAPMDEGRLAMIKATLPRPRDATRGRGRAPQLRLGCPLLPDRLLVFREVSAYDREVEG